MTNYFCKKNGKLSLNLLFRYMLNYFVSCIKKEKNNLDFPLDKIKLFTFYDDHIETPFIERDDLDQRSIWLGEVMLWAIYRVWYKEALEQQIIVENISNKPRIIELFLDNLIEGDGVDLLSLFNSTPDDLNAEIIDFNY